MTSETGFPVSEISEVSDFSIFTHKHLFYSLIMDHEEGARVGWVGEREALWMEMENH
jgi:hypothetical protein